MKIKTSQEISQEYNVTTDGMTANKKWVAVDDLKKFLDNFPSYHYSSMGRDRFMADFVCRELKNSLSTSQSEGTELKFKVPSHLDKHTDYCLDHNCDKELPECICEKECSDKPCNTCEGMEEHIEWEGKCGSCGRKITGTKGKARL